MNWNFKEAQSGSGGQGASIGGAKAYGSSYENPAGRTLWF